ncbi:MAG: hypothetical protein QXE79_03270 [Candidatus Bathyarchaeia archaeon]
MRRLIGEPARLHPKLLSLVVDGGELHMWPDLKRHMWLQGISHIVMKKGKPKAFTGL